MDYTTEHNGRGGVRFDWSALPPTGAMLKCRDGRVMKFKDIGPAGMLLCEDDNGCEQLLFPHTVEAVTPNDKDQRAAQPSAASASSAAGAATKGR